MTLARLRRDTRLTIGRLSPHHPTAHVGYRHQLETFCGIARGRWVRPSSPNQPLCNNCLAVARSLGLLAQEGGEAPYDTRGLQAPQREP